MDISETVSADAPSGIDVTDSLSAEQLAAARAVLAAAVEADGREAVSEAGRLRLRADDPRAGVRHLIQTATGSPLGYAQIEAGESEGGGRSTVELTVHPAHRGAGHGRALVDAVLREAGGAVDFWSHGGHPAARHLAQSYGAELVRELRQMRRTADAPEEQPLPAGVTLRTFRPGEDDEAWLALNAAAFAHHPEQGSWTRADLADRLAEPWFDPAGFFLADRDGQLVGFHWTKVHPEGLGEVYVVGVAPSEQGSGLGRALTATGLRHLILDRKLATVLLYVDADNPAAVRVYERLGFTIHEVDLMYRVQVV
ncbi:mycothiol synthase [Kitasatospora paracochleata]|uniref:Mycothiol acetyltransferase n=1 Tax=Kitasatospora paracochleata TaxID=58354 RepID=A0ABT1IPE1_9ACTN|nr:mycothiol synthase [Kitasatospora paracochleata]MCP2306997.1 mycothiol synthase [Kitasatospora paracochleata]